MTRLRAFALAISLAILGAPIGSQAATPPTERAAATARSGPDFAPTVRTKVAAASLDETYAEREASAKGLETFEGGGAGIYISGGVGAVIVVLLILIIVF